MIQMFKNEMRKITSLKIECHKRHLSNFRKFVSKNFVYLHSKNYGYQYKHKQKGGKFNV